jgi:hypothetical protein
LVQTPSIPEISCKNAEATALSVAALIKQRRIVEKLAEQEKTSLGQIAISSATARGIPKG